MRKCCLVSRKTAAIVAHTPKETFFTSAVILWLAENNSDGRFFRDWPARFHLNTQLPETVLKNQLVLYLNILLFCVRTCTEVLSPLRLVSTHLGNKHIHITVLLVGFRSAFITVLMPSSFLLNAKWQYVIWDTTLSRSVHHAISVLHWSMLIEVCNVKHTFARRNCSKASF